MAKITEKRLLRVSPQLLISNGGITGTFQIADSSVFVVGHLISIKSDTQPSIVVQVKRISNSSSIEIGDPNRPIYDRSIDLSDYLIIDNAVVEAAEQIRPTIPEQEVERSTYAEEPVVARRVLIVDKLGNTVDSSNPLPVEATISTTSVGTPILYNINAALANTEYSQVIPNNTDQLLVRARNKAKLQIAYLPTTASNFITIWPGSSYKVNSIKLVGRTLYFRSTKDDTIVEIEAWTP
jgi:hypothetical protein